ncbi:hypothetical protein [Acidianus sp. HS-5]|uniref:hypothetical protein n=1 Tax=Acidianus sp. HS-5 TaxID=2886040 RepID=UPI001F43D8BC|nr:hypothetical protein [Acidianus sp. HS-5]
MNRIIIGILLMLISISALVFYSQDHYKEIKLNPDDGYTMRINSPIAFVYYKVCDGNVSLKIINGSIINTYGENSNYVAIVKSNGENSMLVLLNKENQTTSIIKYTVDALCNSKFYELFFSILLFIIGAGVVLAEIRKKKK